MSTFDEPQVGEEWEDTKPGGNRTLRPFRVKERRDELLLVEWLDTSTPGGVSKNAFRDAERFRVRRRPR